MISWINTGLGTSPQVTGPYITVLCKQSIDKRLAARARGAL